MMRLAVLAFFCALAQVFAAPVDTVHPARAAQISEIRNAPGVLWQAAPHPRFASQAPGASKTLMGVIGDQKQAVADLVARGEIEVFDGSAIPDSDVPASFDSETNWPQCAKMINDIRDQSNCGCCWAFAGAEAASDRMCIATNASKMVPLSAQDVCFNGGGFMSMGCNGGQITSPWSYMKKGGMFGGKGAVSGGQYQGSGPFGKGFCSDFSLPHCHHHGPQGSDPYPAEGKPGCPHESSPPKFSSCDSTAAAPHNKFSDDKYSFAGQTVTASGPAAIQKAIMAGGPMSVAFTVYSDFENYAGGIYHHVSGGQVGGHAVKVVGWGVEGGVKYWKIANSWNPYWGEKGYFRIKFGEGGIDAQAVASSPDAKWSRAGDSVQQQQQPLVVKFSPELLNFANTSHYEDPKPDGCQSDEVAIQIQGVKGDFCTPKCTGIFKNKCPTDVPAGVTAKPQCALKDTSGNKYCALVCSPSTDEASLRAGDAQCGKATCKAIQGVGLCTYDD